jgi:hypothetical protein
MFWKIAGLPFSFCFDQNAGDEKSVEQRKSYISLGRASVRIERPGATLVRARAAAWI